MKKIGIIGLPGTGKSAVFGILSRLSAPPEHIPGKEIPPRIVDVPDERLCRLGELLNPGRLIAAQLEFREIANLKTHAGDWKLDFVRMKDLDGYVVVLRGFAGGLPGAADGGISPARDFSAVETELILADLEAVVNRQEKIAIEEKRGKKGDEKEKELLRRCRAHLESEKPLRLLALTTEEDRLLAGFQFLSRKAAVAVVNVGEGEKNGPLPPGLEQCCREGRCETVCFCAPLELELSRLDEDERAAFLKELGIEEPARDRTLRQMFRALGLITFFTFNEKEIRAWMVTEGMPAVEAAGKIHSDMQRGFIRAEVINFDELALTGSLEAARREGKLRLEGKHYPLRDGDLVKFRFNV